ncbi:helix-turn-helix transcriptional regulator [Halobaculum limi]|uniref:helix-turn-helix transcriptional regulator n=1 Tax=Halobaculum limi TaxID=3031916 RepID=UPI0024058948|nr:helix-turn-helix transcriptional regulator [Halobaculum sp. YSMS11]
MSNTNTHRLERAGADQEYYLATTSRDAKAHDPDPDNPDEPACQVTTQPTTAFHRIPTDTDHPRCQWCAPTPTDTDYTRIPAQLRHTDPEDLIPDGGVSIFGLTAFQRDCLPAIARCNTRHSLVKGLTIKAELETWYEESINHGRLYPALDTLVAAGLITKSKADGRSNHYELTDAGTHLLATHADRLADAHGEPQ